MELEEDCLREVENRAQEQGKLLIYMIFELVLEGEIGVI